MDKYLLRRQVLDALSDALPAAVETTDVCEWPEIMARLEREMIDRPTVIAALDGLAERGYIENLRPGRTPLWRLTAKGRGQTDREDDLEEYVWGSQASKFQR